MDSYIGKRFEFKYILDKKTAHDIECFVQSVGLTRDAHSENGPYTVNSLYYDTPLLDDVREKDASLLVRRKVRARMYSDSWFTALERVWLEIKKKRNMNIAKTRVGVPGSSWRAFMETDDTKYLYKGVETDDDHRAVDEFTYLFRRRLYRPHVVVKYDRTAYLDRFPTPVRLTFDTNITTCTAWDNEAERGMLPVSRDRVVMELKYNGTVPWWMTHILTRYDLSRDDFSKYRNSVAMLRGLRHMAVNK